MANELEHVRRCLIDAENYADRDQPERSQAYTAIANTWLRLEELKTQKQAIQAFREKRFQ